MHLQRVCSAVLAVVLAAGLAGVSDAVAVAADPPLKVTAVSASGDDGNIAANTLDNNLNTRWSAEGDGVWIQYDLGTPQTIGSVSIAWHKGDTRRDTFDVQLSTDASSWTPVLTRKTSSGTTLQPQNFDFPDNSGRYLRIVGHGNTANNWTSITETTVYGASSQPPGDQTQAAVRYGWGTPMPISDEFDYTGPVDPAKWDVPKGNEGGTAGCWKGHSENGRRCAKNSTVANGIMTMRGEANGDTGWLEQRLERRYGRWEIRSRSRNVGASGGLYHPLHLIWPTSGKRLVDGEYDWVEYSNPDAQCLQAFLHYPKSPSDKKERRELCPVDMTQWHNFAFEWTSAGLVGYVDGVEWFRLSGGANADRGNIQDMPSGHLNIQLDNFTGSSGLRPAVYEVDWVRVYS
ncbi:discoidin domain-containing protein [Kibdelosporangium aridum]|uniref:discoidin domain-containing protein n=1 Tax=Kibdelosporangium aridum TaxID=2030 RepID=UPI000A0165CC|nr:discoidin domain-containing protein [Kibdelosporangium aridum]